MSLRFGSARAKPRVTVGDVYFALSRDEGMREKLGEVHRKLFDGQKLRIGADLQSEYVPEHFVHTEPKRARAEIDEISGWIKERFGDPAGKPPATTPFAYQTYRSDGWVLLFAMLAHGDDREIQENFAGSVAGMSWGPYGASARFGSSGTSSPAAPSTPAVPVVTLLPKPRGRYAPPSTGDVIVPPAPKPPGIIERVLGIKPRPAPPPPAPAPPPAPEPSPAAVAREALAEEEMSPEAEAEAERAFRARAEREAEREVVRRYVDRVQAERELALQRRLRPEQFYPPGAGKSSKARPPRSLSASSETEDAAAAREYEMRLEAARRQMEADKRAGEKLSTVEQLRRPAGPAGEFGG